MQILKNIEVPTGDILIGQGELGKPLEFLSIGDYGKEVNLKADFLGLTGEIHGVEHQGLLPLEEKWVVTISTQYGCNSGCVFCDVPKVGGGINATRQDIINQVREAIKLHPLVTYTNRLNLHFARMGEPTWNPNIFPALEQLLEEYPTFKFHPVISTMLPKRNKNLVRFLNQWMNVKNFWMAGEAGLQFSINSTNEQQRKEMFAGSACTLQELGFINTLLPNPEGRKLTLNFALHDSYEVDPSVLLENGLTPDKYLCKITPIHDTKSCEENGLVTTDGYQDYYPYKAVEERLKDAGYDVIVFVPSEAEDASRITCGNAILSSPNWEV